MKTHRFHPLLFAALAGICFTFASCLKGLEDVTETILQPRSTNELVFPPNSHPHGKSYAGWAEEFWIRLMAFDCETFTSENNNPYNQTHPIFMLGGPVGNFTIDVTIPRNTPIMAPILTFLNDHPCPDPDFGPAPGQTLEEFLQAGAAEAIDMVTNVSATLDGVVLDDVDTYRFNTGLFYFTGHPSLADCADPCVTGDPQAAVTDGYFLILKKLDPGTHTLHLAAEIPAYGLVHSGTFNITVE